MLGSPSPTVFSSHYLFPLFFWADRFSKISKFFFMASMAVRISSLMLWWGTLHKWWSFLSQGMSIIVEPHAFLFSLHCFFRVCALCLCRIWTMTHSWVLHAMFVNQPLSFTISFHKSHLTFALVHQREEFCSFCLHCSPIMF